MVFTPFAISPRSFLEMKPLSRIEQTVSKQEREDRERSVEIRRIFLAETRRFGGRGCAHKVR